VYTTMLKLTFFSGTQILFENYRKPFQEGMCESLYKGVATILEKVFTNKTICGYCNKKKKKGIVGIFFTYPQEGFEFPLEKV
jgi:hypothetical protein